MHVFRWHIKARVTQKSEIKKWHNSKSDGQLFSVHLLDSSGEIKATIFTDQVDRFFNLLEEGKVYYISKARVTMARKQFSTLNNEYELVFENGTEIQAVSCTRDHDRCGVFAKLIIQSVRRPPTSLKSNTTL